MTQNPKVLDIYVYIFSCLSNAYNISLESLCKNGSKSLFDFELIPLIAFD